MSDFLLELSKNKTARNTIKGLGLPLPLPQLLARLPGASVDKPLDGLTIASVKVGAGIGAIIDETITEMGAEPVTTVPGDGRLHGLVLDGTAMTGPADLRALYDFFHGLLKQVGRCGRFIVIGGPVAGLSVAAASAQAALEGFVRALGKEVGKSGSTALLIRVEKGAEARVRGALRFALSPASAFVDLQPIDVTMRAAGAAPTSWIQPLAGKIAVVTGAARGIGAATSKILAGEGAHVVVVDRPADEAQAKEVAAAINGTAFPLNVGAKDSGNQLAQFLQEKFGGVDIVVFNAGITRDKTLARMSPEQWDSVIDVNLSSVLRLTEALTPGTLRDSGRIVCLSSIAGISGNVGQTNYAASKAGIIGFVRAQSAAVAERGITVNAIAPGFIETRMTAAVPFAIREAGRRLSALGQGGQPEDVGQAIAFLSSPGAIGVTGSVLRVCGGALIGA